METEGLTCYFGSKCAVRELDLAVPRGEVFAFLGRNGSGKTTAIRMLLGLLAPTRGSSRVLGCDSRNLTPRVRSRIGYLAEGHPFYEWMQVREAGAFQAGFFHTWVDKTFEDVIAYFDLDPKARVGTLSRGQRAGLCLALTLAQEPELLVLDDPALGLDPVARRALLEAIVHFMQAGERTIFFSSHDLADVERVADRIAILDRSRLRASCPVETFREKVRQFSFPKGSAPNLASVPGLLSVEDAQDRVRLTIANVTDATRSSLRAVAETVEETSLGLADAVTMYLDRRGKRASFFDTLGGAS